MVCGDIGEDERWDSPGWDGMGWDGMDGMVGPLFFLAHILKTTT